MTEIQKDTNESAYVLVNEYLPVGSENSTIEIISVHLDESGAWEELRDIAEQYEIYLTGDDVEFSAPPGQHLEYDDFYIIEKEVGPNRG